LERGLKGLDIYIETGRRPLPVFILAGGVLAISEIPGYYKLE